MRYLRWLLRFVAATLAVLLLVVILAVGTIQTGWFKDWLRRFIVREASQYLNGELRIGRLSGSLFYGIDLADVALVQNGELLISFKDLRVDYSAFGMISRGIVVDRIELNQPMVHARRDADGWNLARLIKRQTREGPRTGPNRPILLPSIVIHDGQVAVDRPGAPRTQVSDLDVAMAFAYQPVNFTIDIANLSMKVTDPTITLSRLSGHFAVRGNDIEIANLQVRLPETELKVDGAIRDYKQTPQLELAVASSKTTFREVGVLLPALRNIGPQPSYTIKTSGPLNALRADVDVRSQDGGDVKGQVTFDITGARRLAGDVQLTRVNLQPWLQMKDLAGSITGRARFDLRLPDAGRGQRFGGTYHFTGPAASAYGYAGENLDAEGSFQGARIVIARARGQAYGAAVTGAGVVDATSPGGITYEFKGQVSGVDMRRVPKQLSVPALESRVDMDYELHGRGKAFKATALFHPSTVEGAAVAEGTRGYFELDGRRMAYGGEGEVADLDLQRLGRAIDVEAMTRENFAGAITGRFRADASGRTVAELTVDADGVVSTGTLFGARYRDMAFSAKIADRRLDATAKGAFTGFNPTRLIDNPRLDGTLNGTIDGRVTLANLEESITFDTFGFDGRIDVKDSTLFDLTIASGFADATVADEQVTIRQLSIDGPDVAGTASGLLVLDEQGASDVTYRFTVPDLGRMGKRIDQPLAGTADIGGKLTGNGTELVAAGTAHVKALKYADRAEVATADTTYEVALPDLDPAKVRAKGTVTAANIKAVGRELPTFSGDVSYTDNAADFHARTVEGPRTVQAAGRVLLLDGRQEIHLPTLIVETKGARWEARSSPEAVIVYDGQTIDIKDLQMTSGAQRITANGVVGTPAGAASTLKIAAENVDLAQVERMIADVIPDDQTPPRYAGLLTANATVTGPLDSPAVDSTFAITNGAFRGVQYQRLGGTAMYDRRRVTLDVNLEQSPGTSLTAKGTVPISLLSRPEPGQPPSTSPEDIVDLHVQSTPVNLGLIEGVTQAVTDVSGSMQLDMRVKGRGRDVAFEGFVRVDQGAFTVAGSGASYTGLSTNLQFEPTRLVVDGLRILDDGQDPLEVKGEVGLTGTRLGTLNLTAHAERFEVLHNDLGEVDVNADVRVQGELIEPRIAGNVEIMTGRVQVDRLLRRLAAGAYSTEAASAIPAAGLRESAPVTAPSSIPPPGAAAPPSTTKPAPAAAAATPPATPPPATGTPAATGTAEAPSPATSQPAQTQAGATTAGATSSSTAKPGEALLSPLQRMHLDLRVKIPDNVILRGKDLRLGAASMGLGNINVTVGGELRLMRQPATPLVVAGTVNTVRGTYDFRGRRFDILRDGRIAFQGPSPSNPALDVTAQRTVQPSGIEARIRIQGTARNPRLEFSSNPPMDESDVLALIVFNQPLGRLESGQRNSLATIAAEAAAGFFVSPLADTVGRALDLDLFEIGTTTDVTGGTGGSLTVGKQINEKLFFRFRQQFGSQEVSEFILEYQLARFLRLQATGAEGDGVGRAQRSLISRVQRGGIDLIFYFSY